MIVNIYFSVMLLILRAMFVSAVSPTLRTVLFSAKFDSAQYYPHGFLPSTLLASNHKGIQFIQKFLDNVFFLINKSPVFKQIFVLPHTVGPKLSALAVQL